MTKEEYKNLKIDHIIYNTETNQVMKLSSQWSLGYEPTEKDLLSLNSLYGDYWGAISMSECDKFQYVSDESPLEVRFQVLSKRFFDIEAFVYQRLN